MDGFKPKMDRGITKLVRDALLDCIGGHASAVGIHDMSNSTVSLQA